ncbi:MAG: glycoside hydrolase family 127 protein [Armatimonadetes bacterium]|nr:glycoside hydrolase family 127 protein [Armatimonadota bacterium]
MFKRQNVLMPVFLIAIVGMGAAAHTRARERVPPVVPIKASLFPLEDVRLLPGPFQQAQDTDRAYLLRLNPDSLLAWMRQTAGLKPKAPHYGGWDSGGAGTIGHYLSACSQMAQATGDPQIRQRVDYVVSEMAACQKGNGDGGLYPSPWDKGWFAKLAAGQVQAMNTTPWYTAHKTLAGLRDAWLLCGNRQARDVLIRMADWCAAVTAKLTPDQWQEMLGPPQLMGEFGGPHEVLADVYAITGDRKYLTLAEKFCHDIIFDPLARGDGVILDGQHANCEIPKFVGYERIYELTGDKVWHTAAQNFWANVTGERTWANGGNSQWEHFFAPAEYESKVQEICGPETCNTYNMLKLTQALYTLQPSARYMDFYERALYNHILSSEAPGGGFVYYTPMRPGHYRVYSRPFDAFWCCVGTGMENHGKYGKMIYAAGPNRLYVNLFIPSVLHWKAQGLTLRQDTIFPQEPRTRLALTLTRPRRMTLSIRYPGWVAPGALKVSVNGAPVPAQARPGSYADVTRIWKSGDHVEVALPMRLRAEPLPHSADYAAFLYGPILLAGPLGTEGLTRSNFYGGGNFDTPGQLAQKALPISRFPVLVGTPQQAVHQIGRVAGQPLTFRTRGLARPEDVTLIPFYQLHFQRYAIYWPIQSQATYAQEQRDAKALEARTVDRVRVGEPDSETAHHLVADRSNVGGAGEPFTHWRDAQGSFRYDLKVLPDQPLSLRCVYWGSDAGRAFDISVDGTVIATEHLTGRRPDQYLPVTYPIPEALTRGKQQVTVRFAPKPGSTAGGVFDCRIVRREP